MSHISMSHATRMNKQCHTYECVMSHIWTEWVLSHVWTSHDSRMDQSRHTYEWVMSPISHVPYKSCPIKFEISRQKKKGGSGLMGYLDAHTKTPSYFFYSHKHHLFLLLLLFHYTHQHFRHITVLGLFLSIFCMEIMAVKWASRSCSAGVYVCVCVCVCDCGYQMNLPKLLYRCGWVAGWVGVWEYVCVCVCVGDYCQ